MCGREKEVVPICVGCDAQAVIGRSGASMMVLFPFVLWYFFFWPGRRRGRGHFW